MSALIGILKYVADPETTLASITYWMMGSLADISISDVLSVLPVMVIAAALLAGKSSFDG